MSDGPSQTPPLRSILRNRNTVIPALRITIPGPPTTATATPPRTPSGAQNRNLGRRLPHRTLDAPLPSPPLPPPPPPNTPTGVRFAEAPRRPSRRRARRALKALPYNGALRPRTRNIPDDAHNASSIIVQAERAQLRRKRHSSTTDLELAALQALSTWGPDVWQREVWEASAVEPDDSTRWGRRRRQPEAVL